MSGGKILHFALGPVQGFISQARRTRDYWAGSFLLSYLSGVAMRAIQPEIQPNGRGYGAIEFPAVAEDELFQCLVGTHPDCAKRNGPDIHIGTLPNRFKARIDPARVDEFGPDGDDPCTRAIRAKWRMIAEAVWATFLQPLRWQELGGDERRALTRAIWERQIGQYDPDGRVVGDGPGFWETSWVMGDDPGDRSDGAWLDRRKNWRSQPRLDESGDKCRMMSEYQELSGWLRSRKRGDQDKFWNAVQERVLDCLYGKNRDNRDYNLLELGKTERLCAIALVKRLFPLLPADRLKTVLGWLPDGPPNNIPNWKSTKRPGRIRLWPSTAYMAAVPWMESAYGLDAIACRQFAKTIRPRVYREAVAERESRVRRLADDLSEDAREDIRQFGMLGGDLFFEDMIKSEIEKADEQNKVLTELRELWRLLDAKRAKERTFRQAKFDRARPFYGLLLMDGDEAGKLIQELGGDQVSRAFGRFTDRVQALVREHDGVLIYAGGDDVQAFLPLTTAIECVRALHCAYLEAFAPIADLKGQRPTISAGLIFAHYHLPLGQMIREAHDLLAKTAKDGNGRNSVAIAVWKPSGQAMAWVSGFARDLATDPVVEDDPFARLMPLAEAYAGDPERSTSFLYNVKDRYQELIEQLDEEQRRKVLLAEWIKGQSVEGKDRAAKLERERQKIEELIRVCATINHRTRKPVFNLDGGLIARFLADNGVGATP
jgi:CRISPR-associated protein Cmr2